MSQYPYICLFIFTLLVYKGNGCLFSEDSVFLLCL